MNEKRRKEIAKKVANYKKRPSYIRYWTFTIILLTLLILMPMIHATYLEKGWWKFNETSGNTSYSAIDDLNLTVGAGVTINQSGVIDKSIKGLQNDTTSYVRGTKTADLNIPTDISISFWWAPLVDINNTANSYTYIFDAGDGASSKLNFECYTAKVQKEFDCKANQSNGSSIAWSVGVGDNNFPSGSWYYVVLTRKQSASASDIKIYKNGSEVTYKSQTNTNTAMDVAENKFAILNIYNGTDGTNKGTSSNIDDFRIYNFVLDANDINAIYNSGSGTETDLLTLRVGSPPTQVATPSADIPTGTYNNNQTVTLTDSTADSNMYYTIDGSTPNNTKTVYTSPITISSTTTLKVIGIKSGLTDSNILTNVYTMVVLDPTADYATNTYNNDFNVTISEGTTTASVYYTVDGSVPNATKTHYTTPVLINATTTFKFIGLQTGYTDSNVITKTYTMAIGGNPSADIPTGTYNNNQIVTLTKQGTTTGTTLTYTTTGVDPTIASTVYSAPITVSSTEVLKFGEFKTGYTASSIIAKTYTMVALDPTANVNTGTYNNDQTATLSDATTTSSIYYTIDGSVPNATKTLYTAPITISTTTTLKFIGLQAGYTDSNVITKVYTLVLGGDPTANYNTNTYNNDFNVTLTKNGTTTGTTMTYTTNGAAPTIGSTVYTTPILINATTTLKFAEFKTGYPDSNIITKTYTMAIGGNPTADISSLNFLIGFYVTLTKQGTTTGTELYYTINSADPTTTDTLYTVPIFIHDFNTTLKFREFKTGYTSSSVITEVYTYSIPIIKIYFYDENSMLPLTNTINILDSNGSTYHPDVNGLWNTTLALYKSFTISLTGYTTRYLDYNFMADGNYNFLMLPTTLGSNIEYEARDMNNNLWNNKILSFQRETDYNYIGNNIIVTPYILDSNSTEVSTNSSSYILMKTFTYSVPQYISSVQDEIKSNSNSYDATCLVNFSYINHSDYNTTAITYVDRYTYQAKTYTNSNETYKVTSIKVYLKVDTGGTGSERNTNIYTDRNIFYQNSFIGSLLTDITTAKATFFVNPSGDYNALLYDSNGSFYERYQKTTVSILKPIDEETLGLISPYTISVGGLLNYVLTNQTGSSAIFNIFAGTTGYYSVTVVDYNATVSLYVPRNYQVLIPFGTSYVSTYSIQPYLVKLVSAVVPTLYTLDNLNRFVSGVQVVVMRYISGTLVNTETDFTDGAGKISFSAIPLITYYFNAYYNGVLVGNNSFVPRSSTDTFVMVLDINPLTNTNYTNYSNVIINLSNTPDSSTAVNPFPVNFNISSYYPANLTGYDIYIYQNGSLIGSSSSAITQTDYNYDYTVNVGTPTISSSYPITVYVDANYTENGSSYTVTNYKTVFITETSGYTVMQILTDIPNKEGRLLFLFLSLIITVGAVAFLSMSGLNINTNALVLLGTVILGVFVFIGWISTGTKVLGTDPIKFLYALLVIFALYRMYSSNQEN